MQALEAQPGVDDWLIRQVTQESTQYYLAGTRPENRRSTRSERLEVEVYNDHPGADGSHSRGSAALTLLPGDAPHVAARLADGVFVAGLTANPPFGLPGPAIYPEVLIADRRLQVEPDRMAGEIADEVMAAVGSERGASLASAEVFVDRQEVAIRNSRGLQARQQETSLLVDLVLLARDASTGAEMESHIELRRRALANLDLGATVRRQARYARDSLRATVPATGRFAVIVSGDALRDLLGATGLSPLAFRASAQSRYQNLSPWEVGRSVFGENTPSGDPLTVYANAVLPYGTHSTAFDREGLPGQRLLLIENGVLRSFWATQRYAEYLQVPPTGGFGNLELLPGSMPVADMWQGEDVLYHIVAFSSMAPDPVTGHFVGEIRLGYERRGGEVRPVKGGSLSGNLFDALATARFSQETVFLGSYLGPEAVRFPALTVSGE